MNKFDAKTAKLLKMLTIHLINDERFEIKLLDIFDTVEVNDAKDHLQLRNTLCLFTYEEACEICKKYNLALESCIHPKELKGAYIVFKK